MFVCVTQLFYKDLNWQESLLFSLKSLYSGNINQGTFWGNLYMQFFLFSNLVILGNFVIAIMTKSRGNREMISLKYFDDMEFNDKHGAIVCSDLLMTPFYWVLLIADN